MSSILDYVSRYSNAVSKFIDLTYESELLDAEAEEDKDLREIQIFIRSKILNPRVNYDRQKIAIARIAATRPIAPDKNINGN